MSSGLVRQKLADLARSDKASPEQIAKALSQEALAKAEDKEQPIKNC